jgi:hypothetical protein
MAKAQSDTHPPDQIKSRGKTQVNYNVHEIEVEDPEGGTRTAYEYDYVEVAGQVTKAKVLAAMEAEELEDDPEAWTPDGAATQYSDAKGKKGISQEALQSRACDAEETGLVTKFTPELSPRGT